MVRGLDVFREHFAVHAGQFVLIGGTAATIAMEQAGLEFRATKDFDIVLHIEALRPEFGAVFWRFIEAGRYEIGQASDTGKPVFYRFQKPADERFPAMLELFCRAPDGINLAGDSRLAPIPINQAAASLSAILLDDAYYQFILTGRKELDGLPWVSEDRLIPLKASAWLNLGERQTKGETVDSRDIRKHANDVLRPFDPACSRSLVGAPLRPELLRRVEMGLRQRKIGRIRHLDVARIACHKPGFQTHAFDGTGFVGHVREALQRFAQYAMAKHLRRLREPQAFA